MAHMATFSHGIAPPPIMTDCFVQPNFQLHEGDAANFLVTKKKSLPARGGNNHHHIITDI
jgi:hypothetical protein